MDGVVANKYYRGIGLIGADLGGGRNYYLYNAHGDVTSLTNTAGTIAQKYDYDAFGNLREMAGYSTDNDANPFRYCGEYFDEETGTIYLRARYYDPSTGRFTREDPIRDGLNWYTYAGNNPVMFIDPSGYQRVAGYYRINGLYGWYSDPDASEFGEASDTYKIIDDTSNRWLATNDKAERDRLHGIAEDARRFAREGTPYMYEQDIIMETLHANVEIGEKEYETLNSPLMRYSRMLLQRPPEPGSDLYIWFVRMTCSDWDYKQNSDWQVPYNTFNGMDMTQTNGKNWVGLDIF